MGEKAFVSHSHESEARPRMLSICTLPAQGLNEPAWPRRPDTDHKQLTPEPEEHQKTHIRMETSCTVANTRPSVKQPGRVHGRQPPSGSQPTPRRVRGSEKCLLPGLRECVLGPPRDSSATFCPFKAVMTQSLCMWLDSPSHNFLIDSGFSRVSE